MRDLRAAATDPAAAGPGLVHRIDSPIGELILAATPKDCERSSSDHTYRNRTSWRGSEGGVEPVRLERIENAAPEVQASCGVASELNEYFGGQRARFDVPLDWGSMAPFNARCSRRRHVPFGHVETYAGIARKIGKPARRAVGNALGRNPIPVIVPATA